MAPARAEVRAFRAGRATDARTGNLPGGYAPRAPRRGAPPPGLPVIVLVLVRVLVLVLGLVLALVRVLVRVLALVLVLVLST